MIDDGQVLVGNAPATKPARLVAPDEPVRIVGPRPRFVGRGGEKLQAALDHFALHVDGRRALDAGSSTGGFTDALLQAGAASVVAVDVGTHQLHERLRADPRVDSREQTDIRTVRPDDVGGPVDLVVADLSFISLAAVLPTLLALVAPDGDVVVLVKPQFEAGRAEVSRGRGVIRDPETWGRVLAANRGAIDDAGAVIMDGMVSPLRGADGNVEFLLHLQPGARESGAPGAPADEALLDQLVADAVVVTGTTAPDIEARGGGAAW